MSETINIKGIIFDFNGTLAFKLRFVDKKKVCELLRKNGFDVYFQEWEAAYNYVFFVEFPKGKINSYEKYFKRVFELLGVNPSKSIVKKVSDYHRKNEKFRFYPDVKFVRKLKVKKAILTTIPFFRFNSLNLEGFDPIFTGKEIGSAKPHPNGFLKIINKWELRPEEVLVVGDDIDIDILPAKKLGFKTTFINRTKKKKISEADYNISSLKDIQKIL